VRLGLIPLVLVALLGGCGGPEPPPPPPPPPPPTVMDMTLNGAADLNPDGAGRPSPLTVRVYRLKSTTRLDGADFFQLFDQEKAVLGDTVTDREELVLTPGGRQELTAELPPDVHFIGVAASYRDIDNAVWHRAVPVQANRTNLIDATFGSRNIDLKATLKPEPIPGPKPGDPKEAD
jgi:type VI secretion system protein VasD